MPGARGCFTRLQQDMEKGNLIFLDTVIYLIIFVNHLYKEQLEIRKIFLDPPRAGLDDTTTKLSQDFENIIYISCNPVTLHRDLEELTKTHTIVKFALFDQFAYSNHIESGVILKKN